MDLLCKVKHKKIELPFCYIVEKEDEDAGCISIEANGEIDGVEHFFYFSFLLSDLKMYDNGGYEQMIDILKQSKNKVIVLDVRYKRGKIKGFSVDKKVLAYSLNDKRFEHIDIIFYSWGGESRKNV